LHAYIQDVGCAHPGLAIILQPNQTEKAVICFGLLQKIALNPKKEVQKIDA